MIILIDTQKHSETTFIVLKSITDSYISLYIIPDNATFCQLYNVLDKVLDSVTSEDIVVCPWCVSSDDKLDGMFFELSRKCRVIVSAGNNGKEIEYFSPTKACGVTVVGSMNKTGKKAKFSNFSYVTDIVLAPGTNVIIDNTVYFGTSVSCAIYAALLAESILSFTHINILLDKYINNYQGQHNENN